MLKLLLPLVLVSSSAFAAPGALSKSQPPRIMVREIEDRSAGGNHGDDCDFYRLWSTPGRAVRELLMNELSELDSVSVLERESLDDLEAEGTRENMEESTKPGKKKFIAANLAVAGSISEFEWCISRGGQGLNLGGFFGVDELRVKRESSAAHVAIDIRLIDVATGKVLKTVHSSGKADESGLGFSADVMGVEYNQKSLSRTPLGKANRMAVKDAVSEIAQYLKDRK